MQPSNSPNGRRLLPAPRRTVLWLGRSISASRVLYHSRPASSITTRAPAWVST
jgi:hypothetical protein